MRNIEQNFKKIYLRMKYVSKTIKAKQIKVCSYLFDYGNIGTNSLKVYV